MLSFHSKIKQSEYNVVEKNTRRNQTKKREIKPKKWNQSYIAYVKNRNRRIWWHRRAPDPTPLLWAILRKDESQENPAHSYSWAPSWRAEGWGGKSSQSLRSRMNASGAECHRTPRVWVEIRRAWSLSFLRTRTQLLWGVGQRSNRTPGEEQEPGPSKHPRPCPGSALTIQDPTFPALHLQPQEETQCSKKVGRTPGRICPATIEAIHKAPVRYPAVKRNSLANMQRWFGRSTGPACLS